MADGYTLRLSPLGKPVEDWYVALSDQKAAIVAARDVAQVPANTAARIIAELNTTELGRLGLAPGHARKADD